MRQSKIEFSKTKYVEGDLVTEEFQDHNHPATVVGVVTTFFNEIFYELSFIDNGIEKRATLPEYRLRIF